MYYFAKILKGKIGQIKPTVLFNCEELCLKFLEKETIEFDGVLVDNQSECSVKIVHKGLNVLLDTSYKKGI